MKQDTGHMNSNDVLGFNFPKGDQISLRRVTTCAPVRQDGFVQRAEIAATYTAPLTNQRINETLYRYTYLYEKSTGVNPAMTGPITIVADTHIANSTYKLV
jgi:hypothetical protein